MDVVSPLDALKNSYPTHDWLRISPPLHGDPVDWPGPSVVAPVSQLHAVGPRDDSALVPHPTAHPSGLEVTPVEIAVLATVPVRQSSLLSEEVLVPAANSVLSAPPPRDVAVKTLPAKPDDLAASRIIPIWRPAEPRPPVSPYRMPEQSRSEPHLQSSGLEEEFPFPSRPSADSNGRLEKRFRSLLELVETEIAYLADLRLLNEVYCPLLSDSPFGSIDVRQRVQRNLQELVLLHEQIVAALVEVDKRWSWRLLGGIESQQAEARVLDAVEAICHVFTDRAPDFGSYALFCSTHTDATAMIAKCAESRPDFEAYEQRCAALMTHRSPGTAKLRLLDYTIKPVQRICRYPLILAYLVKTLDKGTNAHRAATEALKAMRGAATLVEHARVAKDTERKTFIVAKRMEMPSAAQPAFLAFLGQLELVGALQFIQLAPNPGSESSTGAPRIRYLGALLYPTHLVLVKVKKADCYEPRHWFPLRAVSVEKVSEGESMVTHALRIGCGHHRFEVGCVTEAEQDLWAESIQTAKKGATAAWMLKINEGPVDDRFDETTVSSVPIEAFETALAAPAESMATMVSPTITSSRSRFSQMLGRTAEAIRETVDLRLADVFSDACLTARYRPEGGHGLATPSRSRSTPLHRRKSLAALEGWRATVPRAASADGTRPDHGAMTTSAPSELDSGELSKPLRPSLSLFARHKRGCASQGDMGEIVIQFEQPTRPSLSVSSSTSSLPALTALAGPVVALVKRNGSTSSSGSSAPPSPALVTPKELEPPPRWISLTAMSRRSKSAISLLPFVSPEQDEHALVAPDALGGQETPDKKTWRDQWRNRQSAPSLLSYFKPTLSPTLPSPSPAALTTDVHPEDDGTISFTTRRRPALRTAAEPGAGNPAVLSSSSEKVASVAVEAVVPRRSSIKVFRNLTMTRMPSGAALGS